MFSLRDYQSEAILAVGFQYSCGLNRLVINLPTGMGKTVIMCFLAAATPGKIVFIMHREELIDQTIAKLMEICPARTIGKVKAQDKQTDAELVVCSIQTLAASPLTCAALGTPAMIQVDECHHAAAKTYKAALTTLGAFDGVLTVGFTATLSRNDELGLGDVWQRVAYKQTVEWGEKQGFILPTRDVQIVVPSLDLAAIKQTEDEWGESDYSAQALGDALINANAGKILAAEYKRRAGRRRGVVFCPTKKAAQVIAQDFRDAGIATGVITGDTDRDERRAMYDDMRAGRLQVLVNCMVLTEGFDMPEIECVVIARPTKSQSLFVQMRGRGTRPCEEIGKTFCLLLDTVGVTAEHGKNVRPNLKRTGPPVPRVVKPKAPATKATAGPAYKIRLRGRLVIVTRDGVEVARKHAKSDDVAAQLGRLLVKADQARTRQ